MAGPFRLLWRGKKRRSHPWWKCPKGNLLCAWCRWQTIPRKLHGHPDEGVRLPESYERREGVALAIYEVMPKPKAVLKVD